MTRNRCLQRERERERERDRDRETDRQTQTDRQTERQTERQATFLISSFFLVFYVNIQPSCPKTRMEYFNIKVRLLIRET